MTASAPSAPPPRRLNARALLVLGCAVASIAVIGYVWVRYQARQAGPKFLAQAKDYLAQGRPDLAVQYVSEYVRLAPDDLDALELKGKLLFDTARSYEGVQEALQASDKLLRADPARASARKRLVELNLKIGRFQTAESYARELVKREPNDPEAHRLLGRALASLVRPGDTAALAEVVRAFEAAHRLKPGDVDATEQLAGFYASQSKDTIKADLLLDELVQLAPRSAPARLARYRHWIRFNEPEKARRELAEALKIEPEGLDVRLTAAEDARRRDKTAEARAHLAAIAAKDQEDFRVRRLGGFLAILEGKPEEAVSIWREALVQAGGIDEDLTFHLASLLLDLNRPDEADPLIAQYRRLTGGETPKPEVVYLRALKDLKANQPAQAIRALESIKLKINKGLEAHALYNLGQAYLMVRENAKALDAFREAAKADPSWTRPRIAEARILRGTRPDEAVSSLERALDQAPGNPDLLTNLAEILRQRQAQQPGNPRVKSEALSALKRAKAAAPGSPGVALIESDQLLSEGKLDEAAKVLEEAAAAHPKVAEVWTAWANVLFRQEKTADAQKVLDRGSAPEAAGDTLNLRVARSRLLAATGKLPQAKAVLTEKTDAFTIEDKARLQRALGELMLTVSDYAAAGSAFAEWATLLPDDPQPQLAILELGLASADESIIRTAAKALERIEGSGGPYGKLVRVWDILRQPVSDPRDPREAVRRRDQALEQLDQIIAEQPDQPLGYTLKARLLENANRVDDAIRCYKDALARDGGQPVVARLAALLARTNRLEELADLKRSEPGLALGLDRLAAEAALRSGDREKAKKFAAAVVGADPEGLSSRAWQAELLAKVGSPAEAESALRDLAQSRPDDPLVWLALLQFQSSQRMTAAASTTLQKLRGDLARKTEVPKLLEAQALAIIGDIDGAEAAFKAAIAARPDDIRVRREAIRFFDLRGKAAETEASLRHVLKLQVDPPPRWAVNQLALVLSNRKFDAPAWNEAMQLVGPDRPESETPADRLVRALILSRGPEARHRTEAIEIAEAVVKASPNMAGAHELLSRLYLEANQPEKALPHAKAIASEGAGALAVGAYARTLIRVKKLDEAQVQIDRLISLTGPGEPAVIEYQARLLAAQGKAAEASAKLEQAFEVRRTGPEGERDSLVFFRLMAELGPPEPALGVGRRIVAAWPRIGPVVAETFGILGKIDEGLEMCRKAASVAPRAAALSAIALATRNIAPPPPAPPPPGPVETDPVKVAARLAIADALLTPALKAEPRHTDLVLSAAYLRHFQKRHAEEVNLYRVAVNLNPPDYRFMNNLAWTLSEHMNQPADALRWIDEAIRRVGPHPELLDTKSKIEKRLGRS